MLLLSSAGLIWTWLSTWLLSFLLCVWRLAFICLLFEKFVQDLVLILKLIQLFLLKPVLIKLLLLQILLIPRVFLRQWLRLRDLRRNCRLAGCNLDMLERRIFEIDGTVRSVAHVVLRPSIAVICLERMHTFCLSIACYWFDWKVVLNEHALLLSLQSPHLFPPLLDHWIIFIINVGVLTSLSDQFRKLLDL